MPGNVGRIILGPFAAQNAVDALNAQLGYDQPVVIRYLRWAGGLVTGDWGRSLRFDVPVLPLVLERLGRSLILACASLVLLVPVGILLGMLAAEREGGPFDRTVTAVGMALGVAARVRHGRAADRRLRPVARGAADPGPAARGCRADRLGAPPADAGPVPRAS